MRNRQLIFTLLKFLLNNPKYIFIALILGAISYSYEFFVARDKMSFMGVPLSKESSSFHRVFRNEGFMVGYSDLKGNPLWVVYKIKKIDELQDMKRPENFKTDIRNLTFISSSDYTNSGYDRGHMAPNYAISRLYGKSAQEDTFLMTNVTPQKANLNQKIWKDLEEMEIDIFAKKFKEIWVFTGPVFDKNVKRLKSSLFVQIPDAFYKIYVAVDESNNLQTLSLLIPQNVKKGAKLDKFITSIDSIEEQSHIDFLHKLDDDMENTLEAFKAFSVWN